jgi:MFS family permease
VFSGVTALYCLTLPHTPPLAVGRRAEGIRQAGAELFRPPGVVLVLITSFGVYLTIPLLYQVIPQYLEASGLPRAWITAAMTLGQTTEIALLVALPWLLRRFGVKATLALGIAAWLLRFLSLAFHPPLAIAVAGTLLHGAGIACFTVGAQVFLDGRAPGQLRASAQALLLVATSGLGSFVGNLLVGEVVARSHPRDVLVFLFPCIILGALLLYFLRGFRVPACIILGALLLYFLRGFRVPASGVPWAGAPNDEPLSRSASGRGPVARVGHLVTESADG